MLLQAAIETANVERWALERGQSAAPLALASLRKNAYEVSVVDVFHRLARRFFEQRQELAIWERSFQTDNPGRPKSVDIALFNEGAMKETRLELGLYSKKKLNAEAARLQVLSGDVLAGFPTIQNLIGLWEITEDKVTRKALNKAMTTYKSDAASVALTPVAPATVGVVVTPLLASSIDLFVEKSKKAYRRATVVLFAVG